ncbi:MAG: AAA family ATPase [Spirochaetaceae bacterium]|nr:AAA family ATPase [Spirochaetaceae bacterium]
MEENLILLEISLKGFKSFGKTNSTIKLNEDVNVVIGANGSGKSNFISFLEMIAYIASDGFSDYVAKNGFARSLLHFGPKVTSHIDATVKFKIAEKSDEYSFSLCPTVGDVLYFHSENVKYTKVNKEKPYEKKFGVSSERSNLIKEAQNNKTVKSILYLLKTINIFHFNDTSISSSMRTPSYVYGSKYLMSNAGNIAPFLYSMQNKDKQYYDRIINIIREVFPRFDNFTLEPTNQGGTNSYLLLNWKEKGSNEIFGPHQLSDGTLRFIALTTLLLQPKKTLPSVIVLDEPEMGLHPHAIHIVADIIKQVSSYAQIIIATQSVNLLNCFDTENILVAEYDYEQNTSIIKRLDDEKLEQWLEDYSLGELWEKNVLGGVPQYAF